MVKVERITAARAWEQIAGDKRLWNASGGIEGIEFPNRDDHYYLQCVGPHKEVMGNWILYPADERHPTAYRAHINFLSKFWGRRHNYLTTTAGKAVVQWVFENTDAEIIYGKIRNDHPQVQRYATRIGAELVRRDSKHEHYIIRKS